MRALSNSTLREVGARGVSVPAYDRTGVSTGVVHFGPGAFHRVHQACYLDDALASDARWGICEVSLQSPGVRDALMPQDGLYTIAVLDEEPQFRVIGAVRELLVARESPQEVLRRLTDPAIRLVTATITEKGYCLGADGGLDFEHPQIRHDLQNPDRPVTLVGYLAAALQRRRTAGIAPPNVVTCDNLTDNGRRLRTAVLQFVGRSDPDLAAWIAEEVAFPRTMVDSITPATDDALRSLVARRLGVTDRWPVQRESFLQWVIEDCLRGPAPDWEACGITLTDDVAGYERAKLRLLNGAHSSLAYIGSLAGLTTVSEAMNTAPLAGFVERLMSEDIAPGIVAPRGLDLDRYIQAVLQRFRNPAMRHLLAQIAWDGSQKIPFRLLGTIADGIAARRSIERLCVPVAAWFHFVRRKARRGERAIDPLADRLYDLGHACTGDPRHDVDLFLGLPGVFSAALSTNEPLCTALRDAYGRLERLQTPDALTGALAER